MSTRPTIGDFRGPPTNSPRQETPAAPPVEKPTADDAELLSDLGGLSPVERYREQLKRAGISKEEAQLVYDSVLEKGYYEEALFLDSQKKRRVTFRTRLFSDQLRLQAELELRKPTTNGGIELTVMLFNLAASLYEWDGKPLLHDTDEQFDVVMNMLRKLPAPLINLLQAKLAAFDQKTMLVFAEGAVENF